MKTLIIIDVQNDFLPGGALEVKGSAPIIECLNKVQSDFDLVIATQDWHPENHMSFARNHPGKKAFEKIMVGDMEQVLWPNHCVQDSEGARFPPELDTKKVEAIFRKGMDPKIDSYSAFYDNGHKKSTGLAGYLREKGARELWFGGLAADICVYYSLLDALKEGFSCGLIVDGTFPLEAQVFEGQKAEYQRLGVKLEFSANLNAHH